MSVTKKYTCAGLCVQIVCQGPTCSVHFSGNLGLCLNAVSVTLQELAEMPSARQKRILANRQSAARSKERKLAYISELEAQVPLPSAH